MDKKGLAIVTGASSGIGKEISLLLAKDKYSLLLVGRDKQQLEETKQLAKDNGCPFAETVAMDLTTSGAARKLFDLANNLDQPIEVLVNNAGFGGYGKFADQDLATNLEMIKLNVELLTELTGLFLPKMITAKHGYILQVASVAGFQPGPLMAVYYASKAYVLSFGEALFQETRTNGVVVSTLCPGPTKTAFQKNAAMDRVRLFDGQIMTASVVAAAGYKGLMSGQRLIVPGWKNKFLIFCLRFMPRALTLKIVEYIQRQD